MHLYASHSGFLLDRGRDPPCIFFPGRHRSFLLVFLVPLLLPSLFLFEPVSYLLPKFLPDKREVVYERDHRCQLRGTGSWQLISSSDHSRMNRSTWATMLTVSLWVAGYERILSVVYSPSWFSFFIFNVLYSMFASDDQLYVSMSVLLFLESIEKKTENQTSVVLMIGLLCKLLIYDPYYDIDNDEKRNSYVIITRGNFEIIIYMKILLHWILLSLKVRNCKIK